MKVDANEMRIGKAAEGHSGKVVDYKTGEILSDATAEQLQEAEATQSGYGDFMGPIEVGEDYRLVYVTRKAGN